MHGRKSRFAFRQGSPLWSRRNARGNRQLSIELLELRLPCTLNAGDILVADPSASGGSGAILRIDRDTGAPSVLFSGGHFVDPHHIAIERTGHLLVADHNAFGGPGGIIRVDPVSGAQTLVSSGGNFFDPSGPGMDLNGDILVADPNRSAEGKIVRVNPVTGAQILLSSGGLLVDPFSVTVYPGPQAGDIVVVDRSAFGGLGGLIRVDTTTGVHAAVSSGGSFVDPFGMAIAADGEILVADFSAFGPSGGILQVDPATGDQTHVSSGGNFFDPSRIAVAANGDLFVTDQQGFSGGAVIRVDPLTGSQAVLTNGAYLANVTTGDYYGRDNLRVRNADTGEELALLHSAPSQWTTHAMRVTVTDGTLSLEFDDLGGDPYWVLNGLEIRSQSAVSALLSFDNPGPGMVDADPLGPPVAVSGMTSLPAGTLLTVTTSLGTIEGDASAVFSGAQVAVDVDGTFTMLVRATGGAGTPMLSASTLDGFGATFANDPAVLQFKIPAVRRFDFDAAPSSPSTTQAGFISMRGSQVYSSIVGFGWNAPVGEFDRGTAASTPALKRDGHWGIAGQARAFRVAANTSGPYDFRAYVGDAHYGRDNIALQAEGGVTVTVNTGAGVFMTPLFGGEDVNDDGVIDVTISDLGGDPYWVINGLDVATAGNLPLAPLQPSGGISKQATDVPPLKLDAMQPIVDEAIARWLATGLSGTQAGVLAAARVRVADLDEHGYLGAARRDEILLDDNAAGHGWYWDAEPYDDLEFIHASGATEWYAAPGTPAGDRIDLLSVVLHELGHLLSFDDIPAAVSPHHVMTETLGVGVRRVLAPLKAPLSEESVAMGVDGATGAVQFFSTPKKRPPSAGAAEPIETPLQSLAHNREAVVKPNSGVAANTRVIDTDLLSRKYMSGRAAEELDAYFAELGELLEPESSRS